MSKILDLINIALKEDISIDAHVSFGNIFNSLAQVVQSTTGVDCKGSEVIISLVGRYFGIRHSRQNYYEHAHGWLALKSKAESIVN